MNYNGKNLLPHKKLKSEGNLSKFSCEQVRDLTLIKLSDSESLVIAVDSDGGIGALPNDIIKRPGYDIGRFSIRVPLMEILACGAQPAAAFNTLTVPMDEYGKEIIHGIRHELLDAGLPDDFPLSGSTEDNIPTTMTGIGTMVIGGVTKDSFRPGSSRSGDLVFCIGLPKCGPDDEVTLDDQEIVKQHHIRALSRISGVHDMLPVGSKGILHEVEQMAAMAQLKFFQELNSPLDIRKSAGPSTCLIISIKAENKKVLTNRLNVPINFIGRLDHL